MKKICAFFVMLCFISALTTACAHKKQKPNMIQSKRRFSQYVEEPQTQKDNSVVDLSEGPRIQYEANFGPKNPNFDIKIVDPY